MTPDPDIVLLRVEATHDHELWGGETAIGWKLLFQYAGNPFDILAHIAGGLQHDMKNQGVPVSALRWKVLPFAFPREDS